MDELTKQLMQRKFPGGTAAPNPMADYDPMGIGTATPPPMGGEMPGMRVGTGMGNMPPGIIDGGSFGAPAPGLDWGAHMKQLQGGQQPMPPQGPTPGQLGFDPGMAMGQPGQAPPASPPAPEWGGQSKPKPRAPPLTM